MVEEGTVQRLTDGHTFEVFDRAAASANLELLLDQAMGLQRVALDVVGERRSVSPEEFVTGYTAGMNKLGVGGANPNPLFTAMMALNQLREIGLVPVEGHTDKPRQRTDLVTPTVPTGRPHGLAIVPAAAEMIEWKPQTRPLSPSVWSGS